MAEGMSPADVGAVVNNNRGYGYGYDGAGWGMGGMGIGLFAILFLVLFAGGGAWGNRNQGEFLQTQMQQGFDNQNTMANQRELTSAVTSGTAQAVAATNQTFHDTVNVLQDKYSELQRDIAGLAVGQANVLAKQNECCCNTLRAIDGVNYNAAQNTAAINANTTAAVQKVLDAISQNKIDSLEGQVAQLQLAQTTSNVVRYPNAWTWNAGPSPFCGGGFNGGFGPF